MDRVIVVGANGFIGSSVINRLINNSVEVVAVDISHDNPRYMESERITAVTSSLEDEEVLFEKIPKKEYDAFYNFAWRGVNGPEKANPYVQIENIKYATVCASVAKRLGCKKYLCAGSVAERAVESIPNLQTITGGMMYGVSKFCTQVFVDSYCKNIGLDFVWMQFSNIYGPTNKTGNLVSYTLGQLLEGKEAQYGPACQPYDFIYVEDLINAICRLGDAKTTKSSYFIGSGAPRVLKEYLYEIGDKCGKRELVKIGERPDDGVVYNMEMFDISLLVEDIGEYVNTNFSEGIDITIANY